MRTRLEDIFCSNTLFKYILWAWQTVFHFLSERYVVFICANCQFYATAKKAESGLRILRNCFEWWVLWLNTEVMQYARIIMSSCLCLDMVLAIAPCGMTYSRALIEPDDDDDEWRYKARIKIRTCRSYDDLNTFLGHLFSWTSCLFEAVMLLMLFLAKNKDNQDMTLLCTFFLRV